MADYKGPVENNPKLFIEIWRLESWKQAEAHPEKYRGLKIWAHDLEAKVVAKGYLFQNKAGEELTGGKLTRFLTRMRRTLELNLQRFDDMEAQDAFALVNGVGNASDWKKGEGVRPMFVKVEEVTELVEEDDWSDFKKALKI